MAIPKCILCDKGVEGGGVAARRGRARAAPAVLNTPRKLVAALGGAAEVARLLDGVRPTAVRQWSVRGYVPFRHLLVLRQAMADRQLSYTGPVTPGLEEAPR